METKDIKDLMNEFDKSDLTKMKIKQNDFLLEMEKYTTPEITTVAQAPIAQASVAPVVEAPQVEVAPQKDTNALHILSPMVGTFYAAPSPTSPDFVKVGDVVQKGQTVAIVEAMKIMNDIEAEFECKIVEILVKNGQIVEYDMPLFVVEKL
jgi:acetyl-CoA carboxylase biotin carboxyl carrier protein